MTLGKRIKAARESREMTQPQLGKALGVKYQAVSQWERDETSPEPHRIPALVRHLRVPAMWLLEGPGDTPPDPDDLEAILDRIPAGQRAHAVQILRTFGMEAPAVESGLPLRANRRR